MITEFLRLTLYNQGGTAPDRLIAVNPEHIASIEDEDRGGTAIRLSCGEELEVREALLVVLNMLDRRSLITPKTKT